VRLAALLTFAISLPAADLSGSAAALLSQKCQSCHGPQVQLSGLRLDTREAILRGGKQGPALTPGQPQNSLLFHVVSGSGKVAMPPTGPLAPAEVTVLREWIAAGALWPAQAVAAKKWWSFEAVKPVPAPAVADAWVRTPVDAFILRQLQAKGLSPAPEADRPTLLRRAMLDLHGLPPTAAELDTFEKDPAPDAYEKLIDRLLASPRYGEKWGKHWLDLVRYGDTSGFEQDPYLLYAWRYRDYVIDSFNADKPYDRFVKEQLAGDEIYEEPSAQQGTGYYTVGPNRDMLFKVEDINRIETLTDFVDTTSSVFLGLTVGCARCHDHKYDPISQKDYFRLQAIFAPIVKSRVFLTYNLARQYDLQENTRQWKLYDLADEFQRMRAPYVQRLRAEKLAQLSPAVQAAFATEEDQRTPQQKADFEMYAKKVAPRDDEVFPLLTADEKAKLDRLKTRLLALYSNYAPGPFSPSVTDSGPLGPPVYIPGKNNDAVPPGFLSALGGGDIPPPPPGSATTLRRKALAEWIASPNHPLTARVAVNRVWQAHFGRGLVATTSDFGARSAPPTHPELLDWLAADFVAKGWSFKQLHRTLMLSSVYRQQTKPTPAALTQDPENQWLSHFTRRRLEAEEVRDAVLLRAGTLNPKMHGKPVVPALAAEELYGMSQPLGNAWVVTSDPTEHTRRSIYMISRRNFRMPMLEVFDRPEGVLSCARRESSTTPTQSLSLLNSDFTRQQALALAATSLKGDEGAIAEAVFLATLARRPDAGELAMAREFLTKQTQLLGSVEKAAAELARGLFNTNEFLYVD
jgi:hypothetical protein